MQTPKICLEAKCLFSLADLTLADTEPPLSMGLSAEELRAVVEAPFFVDLPNHTVAVERGVKTTTNAATKSADPVLRDGSSFMAATSREKNKLTVTKKKQWNI